MKGGLGWDWEEEDETNLRRIRDGFWGSVSGERGLGGENEGLRRFDTDLGGIGRFNWGGLAQVIYLQIFMLILSVRRM